MSKRERILNLKASLQRVDEQLGELAMPDPEIPLVTETEILRQSAEADSFGDTDDEILIGT